MAKYPRKNTLKKSKSVKATSMVSKAYVKQYVKKEIARDAENKEAVQYMSNSQLTSAESIGQNARGPFAWKLIPNISQSVAQNGRIGNQVRIRNANIKGYINVLPYDGVTNPHPGPILVKIWLVSCVSNNFVDMQDVTNYSEFFEVGASTTGFQNTPMDLLFPPNKAIWRVHKTKRFKIGYGSNSGVSSSTNIYFDNSPMTHYFNFNYTKYCKKKITYDDTFSTPPNQNLYMVVQCVAADGSSLNRHPAEIHFIMDVQYEDI